MKLLAAFALTTIVLSLPAQRKTYILVHGAWHASWCWDKVVPLLESKGHSVTALDLPGHGRDTSNIGRVTLDQYVRKVVMACNATSEKVVLVGHSMAGVVIAQAAEELGPEKVSKLIFLDAFMPRSGESVLSLAEKAAKIGEQQGPGLLPNLILSEDQKTSTVSTDAVESLFYHDCSPQDVAFAKEHVGPQPMICLATPVKLTDARYGSISKNYILCTKSNDLDKTSIAINVPIEKLFKLESSHSPFFSMPEKLVEILLK